MLRRLGEAIESFLSRPGRVLAICTFILFLVLVTDGTLFRIWKLRHDFKNTLVRVGQIELVSRKLEKQIRQARELDFVEREARDRFDLVSGDDLVFEFSNDETGFELQESLATK